MIKNERQYRITKAQAQRFEQAIAEAGVTPNQAMHPRLRKAEMEGLRSQLEDLKRELREYEDLRSGKRRGLLLDSIEDLPKTLIQARIAAGLSHEELAAKLGLKPQQIQRYEATNYQSASMERLTEIVRALGVKLRHRAELRLVS
jgi:ribosome-binding protein aMBF1 (putative translation factor)